MVKLCHGFTPLQSSFDLQVKLIRCQTHDVPREASFWGSAAFPLSCSKWWFGTYTPRQLSWGNEQYVTWTCHMKRFLCENKVIGLQCLPLSSHMVCDGNRAPLGRWWGPSLLLVCLETDTWNFMPPSAKFLPLETFVLLELLGICFKDVSRTSKALR